jgi:tetratricopeptide (TPR) repeat protein
MVLQQKLIILAILLVYFVHKPSLSEPIVNDCMKNIEQYSKKFGPLDFREQYKSSKDDEVRQSFLDSISNVCDKHHFWYIVRADLLKKQRKPDEAIAELDKGITSKVPKYGNLIFQKAYLMYQFNRIGVDKYKLSSIASLYKNALESDNSVMPLIYIRLAELELLRFNYDVSLSYAEEGLKLNPDISRMYSIGAIIEQRRGNLDNSLKLISAAIDVGGELIFRESDTVLSLTRTLCAKGRNDIGSWLLQMANSAYTNATRNAELKRASEVIEECKIKIDKSMSIPGFSDA